VRAFCERAIKEIGIDLSAQCWRNLERYQRELEVWKGRISLTGAVEERSFWKLVAESLFALAELGEVASYLDVGSGGGFPAIPLLLCADIKEAVLLEPRERQAYALQGILSNLGLGRKAKVVTEDLGTFAEGENRQKMELITVKGVRIRRKLVKLMIKMLELKGRIIYYRETFPFWGGELFKQAGLEMSRVMHPGGKIRGYLSITSR